MRSQKTVILCVLAVVCFLLGAYMLTIFTAVRFSGMLFCAAGGVLLAFALLGHLCREGRRWALWCRRGLCVLLALGFALFFAMEAWVLRWARTDDTADVTAVVVFGAGVNGTVPSLSLQVRLEAALEYIADKPGIPIVVSGGQGPGEDITEARCMADWLIARGVEPERILLEEKATNTEENVRFSEALLSAHGVDPLSNVAYVTADYHLCRAVYYAAGSARYTLTYGEGKYPYVVPVAAKMPEQYWIISANYFIREAFGMARLLLLP